MRKYLIYIMLLGASISKAQTIYNNYSWNSIPVTFNADTIKSVNGVVITLDRQIKEIYINKNQDFEEYYIFHRRIKVETHKAIDNNNKIYIGLGNVIDIVGIHARFISPAGKITELPQESIRQVENLENKGNYKTFAIEGAVEGGVIEYYYVLRRKFKGFGTLTVQDDEPRANVEVVFCFPNKLDYRVKGYNGFPNMIKSSPSNEMTKLSAHVDYVPSIRNEKYAFVEANKMRCEFVMAYNHFNGALRTYSWNKVADNLNSSVFKLEKNEIKAAQKLIKKIDNPSNSLESRIRSIENWVKGEVAISEEMSEDLPIDQTIALKHTTPFGATRLMVSLLQTAQIPFELVMTSNRENRPFDPEFNAWNFLDEYLIYFPLFNKVMKPDDIGYRLGIVPSEFTSCYGLFLHPLAFNEKLSTLAFEIKEIPSLKASENFDSMIVKTTVDLSTLSLNAKFDRQLNGRTGAIFQSFWSNVTSDKHKELIQDVFGMGSQSVTVNHFDVKNSLPSDIGLNPIVFNVDVTSNSLVEMAGNDLLVKIGEVIGEQSQLYQTSTRQLPIDLDILHGYYRRIEFVIPDGYQINNLESLNMNVEMKLNDKVSCAFSSSYELKGQTLTIISREYYNDLHYDASRFEEYRQVINAAADFNKKTLVLVEKK